jgi:hypothetical protein
VAEKMERLEPFDRVVVTISIAKAAATDDTVGVETMSKMSF